MPTDTKPALPPMQTVANYNERRLESEWLRDHSHEYPGERVALGLIWSSPTTWQKSAESSACRTFPLNGH